jgi:transcriptional regulator with XRE-family HTH domain
MRAIPGRSGYCCGGYGDEHGKGSKRFFFEKKKQKTFDLSSVLGRARANAGEEQKFFASFFQKRSACLLPSLTPFGEKLRALRLARGILQQDMAAALAVSPAYLSALEHGRRGAPSAGLIHQICEFFGLIWDDADELRALAKVSRPRLKLNTAGLTAEQTALGNRIARELRHLDPETVAAMHGLLDAARPVTKPVRRPRAKSPAAATGSDPEW